MPLMGVVTGGVDFSSLFIALNGEHYDSLAQQAGAPTVNFGVFINNIISFMIARQGGSLAPRRPAQPRGYPLRARQPGGSMSGIKPLAQAMEVKIKPYPPRSGA